MKKIVSILSLTLFLAIFMPFSVNAQENENDTAASQETGNVTAADTKQAEKEAVSNGKWKTKNKQVYYYVNNKKVKGLYKIGKKYYYFDAKGVQRTGWQKIDGDYYYFKIANGKKGYMVKDEKVNGITLKKNGKAVSTNDSKKKLNVLLKANKIVQKATKPTMSKSEKLKKCFQYALTSFKYRGSPTFHKTTHWEQDYALDMFDKGHGSCYAYGAAFAFLANAAGYKSCYAISSGGHGWAEVNGKVYDLSWEMVDKKHSYYGVDYSLSGVAGRPNYKKARKYVVKI